MLTKDKRWYLTEDGDLAPHWYEVYRWPACLVCGAKVSYGFISLHEKYHEKRGEYDASSSD